MLIGAHVSPAGGLPKAVERGVERSCEAIQIFNQSPRMWKARVYADEEAAAFREALAASPVKAVVIHAIYLLNFASEDRDMRRKSLPSLTASLRSARRSARRAWSCTPARPRPATPPPRSSGPPPRSARRSAESEDCPLYLEDIAGTGGTLGRSFEELAALIEVLGRRAAPRRVPRLLPPAGLRL